MSPLETILDPVHSSYLKSSLILVQLDCWDCTFDSPAEAVVPTKKEAIRRSGRIRIG